MVNIPNINFKKVTDKNNTLFDQTQFYEDNFEKINTLIVPKVNELDGAIGEAEERLEFAEADLDNHEGRIDTVELNKVDKVTGKGLSTNDFTNTLKAKLETEIPAQLAETGNRIDNIIATPIELPEIYVDEIHDARQGKGSVGANIADVKAQLAQITQKQGKIEILNVDPINPIAGQFYLLNKTFRDVYETFNGTDGASLSTNWSNVLVNTTTPETKADIFNNRLRHVQGTTSTTQSALQSTYNKDRVDFSLPNTIKWKVIIGGKPSGWTHGGSPIHALIFTQNVPVGNTSAEPSTIYAQAQISYAFSRLEIIGGKTGSQLIPLTTFALTADQLTNGITIDLELKLSQSSMTLFKDGIEIFRLDSGANFPFTKGYPTIKTVSPFTPQVNANFTSYYDDLSFVVEEVVV